MKKYVIENSGCDDSTVVEMELTDEELKTLVKYAKTNNERVSYGCMPEIAIYNYRKTGDYKNWYKNEDLVEEMKK